MSIRRSYDGIRFDPPAPVCPLLVAAPSSQDAILLPTLVASGADCTLIPESVARQLGLPRIDRLTLEGIEGIARPVPVYAAVVEFAGHRVLARLAAYGDDAILGRDLLARVTSVLDGPKQRLTIRSR